MVWVGVPLTQLVEFTTGAPVGDVTYSLTDLDDNAFFTDTLTPDNGAVSVLLHISGAYHTCSQPLFEGRVLTWSYDTADETVTGRVAYRVDRSLPFPVSNDGVRAKLGLEPHELRDQRIDLIRAYAEIADLIPAESLELARTSGDLNALLCIDAIEAQAALNAMPAIQLGLAEKESSGTNSFQRFSSLDWDMIIGTLQGHIVKARAALDSNFDADGTGVSVFSMATRSPDAVTGE